MSGITLHGKSAIEIPVKLVLWGNTSKSRLYKFEWGQKWVPNSLCKYNDESKTLIIEEWFYNKLKNESQ